MTTAFAWTTALDGDHKRHLATRDIDMTFIALCGAQFWQQDQRPVIPQRCAACLDADRAARV